MGWLFGYLRKLTGTVWAPASPLWRCINNALLVFFGYLFVAGLLILIGSYGAPSVVVDLVEILLVLKLVSLIILLLINGEIAHGVDRERRLTRNANWCALFVTLFVFVLVLMKFLGLSYQVSSATAGVSSIGSQVIAPALGGLLNYLSYLSVAPIIAYAVANLVIAVWRVPNSSTPFNANLGMRSIAYKRSVRASEQAIATKFFVYVYLPAMFPLLMLIAVSLLTGSGSEKSKFDLVMNGAMSVVILSSSITARCLRVYSK